jgi:hypothetical protein
VAGNHTLQWRCHHSSGLKKHHYQDRDPNCQPKDHGGNALDCDLIAENSQKD